MNVIVFITIVTIVISVKTVIGTNNVVIIILGTIVIIFVGIMMIINFVIEKCYEEI